MTFRASIYGRGEIEQEQARWRRFMAVYVANLLRREGFEVEIAE